MYPAKGGLLSSAQVGLEWQRPYVLCRAASLLPAALSSALEEMGTAYREGTELQRNSDLKALGVYEVHPLP